MAKRNFNKEIAELKERGEFENGFYNDQRLCDLNEVITIIKAQTKNNRTDEVYKYLPIASVACIESFFRATIKELLDNEGIYFDNLEKLIQQNNLKLDFEVLSNLQKKKYTIGEFVAHTLPCNNINDLNKNISVLLGYDFLSALKKHKPKIAGVFDYESFDYFKKNYNSIAKSIVKTFEFRHIFCHESARKVVINKEELEIDSKNCQTFLNHSSSFILSITYEEWGLSVPEKVELLAKELIQRQIVLKEKFKTIRQERSLNSENKREFQRKFDKTIKLWEQFTDSKALLKGSYSMSYIWSEYIYIKDKLKSIQEIIDDIY